MTYQEQQLRAGRLTCVSCGADLGDADDPYRDPTCVRCEREEVDNDLVCRLCAPFDCDDPDRHLPVPSRYTPLRNRGCQCGADFDGRDCMCFEG